MKSVSSRQVFTERIDIESHLFSSWKSQKSLYLSSLFLEWCHKVGCCRRLHQADLGSRHVLCEWEDGLLPRGDPGEPVPENHSPGRNPEEHETHREGHLSHGPLLLPHGQVILGSHWLIQVTWPGYCHFIGHYSQLCTLEIESYGYTMADLVFSWHDGLQSVQVKEILNF